MRYETPKIKSVAIGDVLSQLGPARALLYTPGGGDPGSKSSGGSTGSGGSMGSGSGSGSGGSGSKASGGSGSGSKSS